MGESPDDLTHLDDLGRARMVDVGGKAETEREARAVGAVRMGSATLQAIAGGDLPKGDALAASRLAGIMAAKRTPDLIPLCHPILITAVTVELAVNPRASSVEIEATVRCRGRTGAEMEALTAVSVAALTLYDMAKAIDREMTIEGVRLVEKRGGKGGVWRAREGPA